MNARERQGNISMASLFHRCEKYDEMIKIAKELIKDNPNLSDMEMSVFTESYKCKLNEIRKILISLLNIEKKEKDRGSTHVELIRELIDPKINELNLLCDDFLSQTNILLSKPKNFDSMAFLSSLKCDFLRYKCQFLPKGDEWQKSHDEFFNIIKQMENIGKDFLSYDNINILRMKLSKCVFYYEILNKPKEAIEDAKNLLKMILEPPPVIKKPSPPKKIEKEENIPTEEHPPEKKTESGKKDDKKVKVSAKKKASAKKEEKNVEKEKEKEKQPTSSDLNKEESNAEVTENRAESASTKNKDKVNTEQNANINANVPPVEKKILTQELKDFIYILRTDIILWSGKNEEDVKI